MPWRMAFVAEYSDYLKLYFIGSYKFNLKYKSFICEINFNIFLLLPHLYF